MPVFISTLTIVYSLLMTKSSLASHLAQARDIPLLFRININIAVVEMMRSNVTMEEEQHLVDWTEHQRGQVLGAFFVGYMFTQVSLSPD